MQIDSERFFDLSLDMLCVAVYDGYFKKINPACARTLGHALEALLAVPYATFIHPDDLDATARAAANLTAGDDVIAFENRYRCADGTYKWLHWNVTPFPEEELLYAVAHDVT